MIRRAFLKCCLSAAVTVGMFYGGMGIPEFPGTASKMNSFSMFETLIRHDLSGSVLGTFVSEDDDPIWDFIGK